MGARERGSVRSGRRTGRAAGMEPPPGSAARLCKGFLLLFLLLCLSPFPGGQGSPQGEVIIPHWLLRGRGKRAVGTLYKETMANTEEILVTAEGKKLVLVLERNHQLLSPDYTETHYTADGEEVTVSSNYTDHCYYHGHVKEYKESWVVLSTCSGIRGLIVLNSNDSYYLKPLESSGPDHHLIYRTEHLPIKGGTCGHSDQSENGVADIARFITSPAHHRMKRDVWRIPKYMELFIVADNTLFMSQKRDLGRTKHRILEIANYVDKFYRLLNIKVALIGLEVWTERNQCTVSSDANASLWSFLQWKKKLKLRKKHDNAQLLTGVTFKGTTIGMAPLEGMCTPENSGGVSMDHSEVPIGAAATMAHEIGHNFGMSHDNEGCCVEATPEQGGCVMAAATGHPFPRVFSSCSRNQLMSYFQKGGGVCLFNMPDTKDLVVGKKCGNGFLEEGEECDCGELEECTNPCCHAQNCTLKEGAQCAHGDCCQYCKLKTAGTMCREPSGSCDLPEYCTGVSAYCPSNVYLLDGSSCAYGEAYCYNGMCMTHQGQCVHLWGSGAWPAPDACFQDVNTAGDAYGNCGKDSQGHYVKCERRDAKCGKIQCQSTARKPKGTNTVSMDTTIRFNGQEVKCRGTFTYATRDEEGDLSDPGLVMTGTKCGEGMVCKDRQCQNASFFELEQCISLCHNHGVCNSNKHCHCDRGWAPPYCEKPGLGGSVDSGPVQYDNSEAIVMAVLVIFLLILPVTAFGIYYCYRKENSLLNKWLKKHKARCRNGTKSHKANGGLANAGFILQNVSSSGKAAKPNKTGRDNFPVKPGTAQNGFQPVNIVRPLRPAPSPISQPPKESKPCRPPPPVKKSPVVPAKAAGSHSKLFPPKKPLPTIPVRTPQVIPKHSAPHRPLPGNPLPTREPLLVVVPPSSFKPPLTNGASQLGKPLKPIPPQKTIPGAKFHSTSFPLKK
ncbi:LOW QUALITY PROTEIN: disintegrin and metalloproteinase domain-containing protein 33-like [Rhinatrema bivittatum]|uniref:LOW QUALITY PROTEIN: disintegrin and metalloproteinase domain-containing protein 33-like n=1 Tax=Rhinatrema bivittatum TaxID=194408 RepID=UPI0011289D27|nr:LOW QUALITY PROTEIN: disintegrin and metalloproteinase domain-containing protein 33-like [Rhinatrema bivittatum]